MKRKVLFIVALVSIIFFSSCGHNSGNLIGSFQVIKKIKSNPTHDYGFVILTNSSKDTLSVFISMEEEYLNVKVDDVYLVGIKRQGSFFLNDKPDRGVVGYSKVLQKEIRNGIPRCKVITRGQDTISVVSIAEAVYFNISEGDSVFVKKNRDKNEARYFVE